MAKVTFTQITIRDPDDEVKAPLRTQAALSSVPEAATGAALVADIRKLVEPFGGIELELPPRTPAKRDQRAY